MVTDFLLRKMVLLAVASLAAVIGALYYYFTRTFNYWEDRNVAGPKPLPFFGNLKESFLRRVQLGVVLEGVYNSFPTEKIVGVFRMTSPCLLVRDLEIVKHVLIKDFDNFVDRGVEFSKEGLGQNLFHSDGDTWRALRSRFSPMFTNQKLKNMMYLLNDRGHKFIEYLNEITAKTPEHDVHGLVQRYTMSTISACAFGLDIDTFHGDIETLKEVDRKIFTASYVMDLDFMYPGLLKKLKLSLFPKFVKNFFKEVVATVISERNGMPSTRKDFMDLILEMRNQKEITKEVEGGESITLEITNSVIEAQAFLFYAAGYESSAMTMGFLLYQLALNPEIQNKVRREIDEYLKRHNNKIELETLKELTYLDQVYDETLRMYPIADTLQRKGATDYECPGTNVKVAKDTIFLISVLGIHHDKNYYPEPEKFDPDRFSPENVGSRHPCAYLPFGLGQRRCIGFRFAQVQARVCLINVLSKFTFEAGKNTVRSFSFNPYRFVLAPNKKLYVNMYPRKDL